MNPGLPRRLPALRLGLVCLMLLWSIPSLATPYDDLISTSREQVQSEDFVEALTSAKEAARLDPADYRSPYYMAMAYLGLARFDEAEASAAQALSLADATLRPSIEKLAATIKARRQAVTSAQEADAALADGLNGKAARLYENAWNAEHLNAEAALKAADLYTTRLNQPVDAARVLRQIRSTLPGSPEAEKARTALAQQAETLQKIALARVAAAKNAPCDKALVHLDLAEGADPTLETIYQQRMTCITTLAQLRYNLKGMARLNLATPDALLALKGIGGWMKKAEVKLFMADLIGQTQADELAQRLDEREAAQEAAQAKYRTELAAWEQQDREARETYTRKLAEKDVCLAACRKKYTGLFGNAQKLLECETGCNAEAARFAPKDIPKPTAPANPD